MEKKNIDDVWTYQKIGTPFPLHVVKPPGQANKYVALWYKHGKPIMGRAWNDSGVVQSAFAVDGRVFSGTDVGGEIQLLIYDPDPNKRGFYYEWMPYEKARILSSQEKYDMVKCSNNTPAFWKEEEMLGNIDTTKQTACFVDEQLKIKTINQIDHLLVLCRIAGKPNAVRELQQQQQKTIRMPLTVNDWEDFNWGSAWPSHRPVMSAPKEANEPEQYVALWYRHGKPIMGRAWSSNGKVDAAFPDSNREFTGATVGSLQLLVRLPPTSVGYDYVWLPYEKAMDYRDKDYLPVHLSYICPALVPVDGKQFLGKLNMKTEVASTTVNGKVTKLKGGQVKTIQVLCRREHEETMLV